MNKIWVSSDLHFGHKNIIKFCDRPYSSVEEMTEGLINSHNELVSENDTVYWLGDIFFGNWSKNLDIVPRLNGTIHLVLGNHDKVITQHYQLRDQFASVQDYLEIRHTVDDINHHIIMSHYPMIAWNNHYRGSIMLHGHSHGQLTYPFTEPRRIKDVGVDCNDMKPFLLDDLCREMNEVPQLKFSW